jgi:hypothetical protein
MHHVVYLQSLVRTVLAQEELARRSSFSLLKHSHIDGYLVQTRHRSLTSFCCVVGKNLKIRTLAALEIYDTEKAYVNSLKLMTAVRAPNAFKYFEPSKIMR